MAPNILRRVSLFLVPLVLFAACEPMAPALDASLADTDPLALPPRVPRTPLLADEALGTPVPDSVGRWDCVVDGTRIAWGHADTLGECVACECGVFGLRCARRPGCTREDVCVLLDGTLLRPRRVRASPPVLRVHLHHRGGPVRAQHPRPTVPADGCAFTAFGSDELQTTGFGQRFVSETIRCTCDEEAGFVGCRGFDAYCPAPDGARILAEGARYAHSSGCGTCLCSSGQWESPCDRRGCE
jgi:hypothetical protein